MLSGTVPTFKVVLLGDSGVGKTCMRSQFVHRIFSNGYKATIGGDYLTSRVEVKPHHTQLQKQRHQLKRQREASEADVSRVSLYDESDDGVQSLSRQSVHSYAGSEDGGDVGDKEPGDKAADVEEQEPTAAVSLQIWDTAGQERFNSITQAFYRGTDIVVLVYDITNYESVVSLKHWFHKFLEHCQVANPGVVIVGNKADKAAERVVDLEEIREILTLNNSEFDHGVDWDHNVFEICSKKLEDVRQVFYRVAEVGLEGEGDVGRRVEEFESVLDVNIGHRSCCWS